MDYLNEDPVSTVESTFGWKPPEICFSLMSLIFQSVDFFSCQMGVVDIFVF